MTGGLRSGEVAAAAGVNLQTLRYYERRGLLAEPDRTPGGHRVYSRDAVIMLRVIKAAQRLGFTLEEVAGLLDAAAHRHGARPDTGLRQQAAVKLTEIDARIADLRTIRGTLVAALDAGCDDLATCASSPACPLPFGQLAGGEPAGQPVGEEPAGPAAGEEPAGPAAGEDPAGQAAGGDVAPWSTES
jgi:MerR family mercuric resistance operon transcriptional regulator